MFWFTTRPHSEQWATGAFGRRWFMLSHDGATARAI